MYTTIETYEAVLHLHLVTRENGKHWIVVQTRCHMPNDNISAE